MFANGRADLRATDPRTAVPGSKPLRPGSSGPAARPVMAGG